MKMPNVIKKILDMAPGHHQRVQLFWASWRKADYLRSRDFMLVSMLTDLLKALSPSAVILFLLPPNGQK